jgi:LysM repeat protein
MRAADQAHSSSLAQNESRFAQWVRLGVALLATLALLLVWRPTVLHGQETSKPTTSGATTTHVVKAGETLWGIAARYYGDGHQWQALARRNQISTSGDAPLRIGMSLVVPSSPTVRGAKAAATAAAPADSTVPKVALAKAGAGTLPPPPPPAKGTGSLAAQTSGKGDAAAGTGKRPAARAATPVAATAGAAPTRAASNAAASAAAAQDTSRVNLQVQRGTIIMSARNTTRIGLVGQEEQAAARKPSEVVTVFHRDLPDAAEAERRTRAVLRPNTPVLRQAEYQAAPFAVTDAQLSSGGRIARRIGAPEQGASEHAQRAMRTDEVELTAPAGASYKVGDRLVVIGGSTVVDKGTRIALPTGLLEVIRTDAGKPPVAVVRDQSGRVEQGQTVVPLTGEAAPRQQAEKLERPDVSTTVRWLDAGALIPTLQSYLVVGAGSSQGLKPGDELALYHKPAAGGSETLTATVRLVRVDRETSAAVITRQFGPDVTVGMTARRYARVP